MLGFLKAKEVVREVRVEVPVVGDALTRPIYRVDVATGEKVEALTATYGYVHTAIVDKTEPKYYATCEQAHAENPGKQVIQAKAVVIGSEYFLVNSLSSVEIAPKPKVPKGKKAVR